MPLPAAQAYELGLTIAHANWLLRRHITRRLARPDSEWRLLGLLAELPALHAAHATQAELSVMLGLSPSAFTRLVDRAAARRLIRRVPGVSRRAHSLALTRAGHAAWRRVRQSVDAALPHIFAGVSPSQARALRGALTRLIANLNHLDAQR